MDFKFELIYISRCQQKESTNTVSTSYRVSNFELQLQLTVVGQI